MKPAAPSLMVLPLPGPLLSALRNFTIDRIHVDGRTVVRDKVIDTITAYDKIKNPVVQRICRLLATIHTRGELSDLVEQYLRYLAADLGQAAPAVFGAMGLGDWLVEVGEEAVKAALMGDYRPYENDPAYWSIEHLIDDDGNVWEVTVNWYYDTIVYYRLIKQNPVSE